MPSNNFQKNDFFIIFHVFQVCCLISAWVARACIEKNFQYFRDKSASNFFSIVLTVKPFQHGLGITKSYFQLNFHVDSTHNFYGAQTESFFFSRFFLLCQIIKGSSNKQSDHPSPCVSDHRTASAVTFSLFERYKKYLEGSRRHINSSSSQIFSKIEDGKCFVTDGRTDGRTDTRTNAGNLRGTPLVCENPVKHFRALKKYVTNHSRHTGTFMRHPESISKKSFFS